MNYSEIEYPLPGYGVPTTSPPAKLVVKDSDDDPCLDDGCALYVADPVMLDMELVQTQLMQRMDAVDEGERPEANFIIDFYVVHNKPNANPIIPNNEKIPYHACRTAAESLHLALRNQGHHYHPDGIDTKVNCGMGNVNYINGHDVWGAAWDKGIRFGASDGVSASTVIEYCKKEFGTWQDPTRYAIVVYPRLSGSSTIAGFAYVAVSSTNRLAGQFLRWSHVGDYELLREGEPTWGMSSLNGNGKTCVHEFGHSLGLYHTFNQTDSCDEVHGPLEGDRVSDTPVHTRYNTCGFSINESPRNNHMSYSGANSRVVFTIGQWTERAWVVLNNSYPATFNNPYYDWNNDIEPPLVMPEITSIEQINSPEDGEIAEFIVKVRNTDTLNIEAVNENGDTGQSVEVEYGAEPPANPHLIASFNGAALNANGWLDAVSGNYATGEGAAIVDSDGPGVIIERGQKGFIFNGLTHQDYSYRIKCKMQGPIDNIRNIVMKRETWSNDQSLLYLFTWDGNSVYWDNTSTSNRRDTGYVPTSGQLMDILISRDNGMWVNGVKVAEPGNVKKNIVNNLPLKIGGDIDRDNRGFGGIIYSVDVYSKSLSL